MKLCAVAVFLSAVTLSAQNGYIEENLKRLVKNPNDLEASFYLEKFASRLRAEAFQALECCSMQALGSFPIALMTRMKRGETYNRSNSIGGILPRVGSILNEKEQYQLLIFSDIKGNRFNLSQASRRFFGVRPYIESDHGFGPRLELNLSNLNIRAAFLRSRGYSTAIFKLKYVFSNRCLQRE